MANKVLAVNIGNTHTDIGVVDCEQKCSFDKKTFLTSELLKNCALAGNYFANSDQKNSPVYISSVVPDLTSQLVFILRQYGFLPQVVSGSIGLPIKLLYTTPHTLGSDRIADLVFVESMCNGKTSIVIDAGTAITIDYLKDGKEFMGGVIMPGLMLQSKALNSYTAKLPLVENAGVPQSFPGTSTSDSIAGGILYGVAGAISNCVKKMDSLGSAEIFATGGAWNLLSAHVGFTAHYHGDMTLVGCGLAGEFSNAL